MNAKRRKQVAKLTEQFREIYNEIERIRDEEQEAYDNLPESLQDSERGESMYAAIDQLESAMSDSESAISALEEITNQ